ncbi:hypothetical protein ABTA37_19725, partial [Acinetobacter baumannii]
ITYQVLRLILQELFVYQEYFLLDLRIKFSIMNPKVVPKFKAEKSLLVPRKYDMTVGKFITRPTIKEFLNNNYEFKKKPGSRTIFLRENTPF